VRNRWLASGLWFSLVVSSCASSSGLEAYRPKDADEAALVSSLARIPNGFKGKSVDMVMQAYADDLYVGNFHKYLGPASPTAPVSISKAELREVYTQIFRGFKDVSLGVKDFRLTVNGDRAVAEAKTELLLKNEAGRGESKQGDVYRNEVIWRMRRTPAGWKILEEIWQ
jgi:ketosteroid isomerase-like protein